MHKFVLWVFVLVKALQFYGRKQSLVKNGGKGTKKPTKPLWWEVTLERRAIEGRKTLWALQATTRLFHMLTRSTAENSNYPTLWLVGWTADWKIWALLPLSSTMAAMMQAHPSCWRVAGCLPVSQARPEAQKTDFITAVLMEVLGGKIWLSFQDVEEWADGAEDTV